MIITKTPFRISLFGGGTDFPEFYREHGGLVVGSAIDKYGYVICRNFPQFFDYKSRFVYSKIEKVKHHWEIDHTGIREVIKLLNIQHGVEAGYFADLPGRSGIGSSSTFLVGLLHALSILADKYYDPRSLADLTNHVERQILKEAGGYQDPIWSAFGGLNTIQFYPDGNYEVTPLSISRESAKHLNNSLMLFYTNIKRQSTSSEVTKSYQASERELLELLKVAEAGIRAIAQRDSRLVGQLLHENWLLKKSRSEQVSNRQIDDMYDWALRLGAYGGKLIGAGQGGCLLFAVDPDPEFRRRLAAGMDAMGAMEIEFTFEQSGTRLIHYDR